MTRSRSRSIFAKCVNCLLLLLLPLFISSQPCCANKTESVPIPTDTNNSDDREEIRYSPNWKSLDSRPLPVWYDEAKIGIFLHWGVFSVPSFVDAWFWYWWKGPQPREEIVNFMKRNYKPDFTYQDFANEFTTEFFDPGRWVEIFNASGAKYIVLTAKHHEGFCNWPSNYSFNWNSMDVGPKRDLVGELASTVRSDSTLKFGLYHSLYEFFNPLLLQDYKNDFKTQEFVKAKALPELYELVNNYKPDLVWSDGQWKGEASYWNSTEFLAWLYNDSPVKDVVVTNDRWGRNTVCKHGGYLTCKDHFNPRKLMDRKFEDSTTMTKKGWCFTRNMKLSDVHDMEKITKIIAEVVSCGGNLLLNVGPTKEGIIAPIFEERLREMGSWLSVNGDAIYATIPWSFQRDIKNKHVWYTQKSSTEGRFVYAIVLTWPETGKIVLRAPQPTYNKTVVNFLGFSELIEWKYWPSTETMELDISNIGYHQMPCDWAWALKMSHIQN